MATLPSFKDDWITTEASEQTFTVSFGKFTQNSDGLKHAIDQFGYLYEQTNLPAAISLSGGVDSQTLVLAAVKSKIPFTVYSMRFNQGLNQHDLRSGIELTSCLGVKINFIDIDILKFYTSGEYLYYIDRYQTSSPQVAAFLWFYTKIAKGNFIVSPGNPVIKFSDDYDGMNGYTLFGWERFSKINDVPVVGLFHWFTPELFGSLFREQSSETNQTSDDKYKLKCAIYNENGFNIIPQSAKQNGFERVKEAFIAAYPYTKWPFDTFFRVPHEKKYNKYTRVHGL